MNGIFLCERYFCNRLTSHCRNISFSNIRRESSEGRKIKKRKYFDLKLFKSHLKAQKEYEVNIEQKQIAEKHALPPPDGWNVQTFLKECGIEDGIEEIAARFKSWQSFISCSFDDLLKLDCLNTKKRKTIWRHLNLFNAGWWPENLKKWQILFKGVSLKNEDLEWSEEDDINLLKLAQEYDANFGDPWIYISWELQRGIDETRERYIELTKKDECQSHEWDFSVLKASRPLYMNRKFKLDPPFLYLVPSEENYPVISGQFELPEKFREYLNSE